MSLYSQLDRLASDLETVKKQLHAVANTNQLQRSSVEAGSLDFNDEDGNLKAIIGLQHDGATTVNVVNGPKPAAPAGITADVDNGRIIIRWDGTFAGDLIAPTDWARTEIYAQEGGFVVPTSDNARGSFVSAAGGELTIGVTRGTWTVCVAAWSQAGRQSEMSAPITVEVPGFGDLVQEAIDKAEALIEEARTTLEAGQAELTDKLGDLTTDLTDLGYDIDLVQLAQTQLTEDVTAAITSANSKNTITRSTENPPASYTGRVDDLWWKMTSMGADGRVLGQYRWTGTAWLEEKIDSAVLAYVDAAKITTGFLDVATLIRAAAITVDKLLVGGSRNLLPNGDLDKGSAVGWPVAGSGDAGPVYDTTDKPEGKIARVSYHTISTQQGSSFGRFSVAGMETLVMEAWVKADKPGSIIYVEVRDQDGSHISTASRSTWGTDGGWQGDTAAYAYPFGRMEVPTTWTKFRSTIKLGAETSEVYVGSMYFNHSSGTERDATVSYAGLSLRPMVGGTLIEPGGIQTPHLAADVLEVENLKAGSGQLNEAVITKLFSDVVVARMAQAEEFIGENAILTGAVTAPKITASEELWAKLAQFVTVYAEMVDADVFNGRVFRGSTFLTTNESSWSDRGMFLLDDEGNPRIQAPTDGSDFTVNAEIVAKSLTAAGRASFLAENNRLEPGAGLVLAAGVGDPPSPPVVSNHYKQITPPALVEGESVSGLAYGGGLFWRAIDAGSGNNPLDRIEGIDQNGVIQRTIPLVNFWARNGLAVIGDELFALGIRDDRPENVRNQERWVRVFGLDGTYKRQWEYPNYGTGTYQPGIGSTPAGNVSIAQCWVDGKLSWRTFSPTGTFINITTRDAPVKSDAVGIYGGTADFGAARTVFAKGSTPGTNRQFTVYGTNGNDYFPEQSWYSPGRGDVRGLAWDGEKFYSIDPAGVITEYGSLNMGDDSANWWTTYRWVGSSGKTTRIAPPARFAWARRSRLRVSAPNLPQGVTTIEPSLAFKTTTPTRSEFRSPAWAAGATPSTVNYEVLPTSWQSGSAPGDINNFPNSTPSSVKASTGLFEVKGDGSGRWGPLTFNPDGSMSSSAVPAWVPITAFASGFSAGSFGFAPAYRVWPDGKVEWRGTVEGNVTAYSHDAFTIPSAALPTQAVQGEVATSAGTGAAPALTRCEFRPESAATKFRVYQGGTNRSWFSLDQNWYYKS